MYILKMLSWKKIIGDILNDANKRCNHYNNLFPYLKYYNRRSLLCKNKYLGSTLTPTSRSTLHKVLNKKKYLQKSNFR